MKILYICHRFPFPPKRGGKIRPFNMIRHLSAAGHEVTVASLARSPQEAEEGKGIAPYCARYEMAVVNKPVQVARMVLRAPSPVPSSMGFFYSATLARRVRELLSRERFDLIFVHCSSVAQYVAGVRGIPKILDFGDMDSQKWLEYARYKPFPLSAGYWLEGRKMERAEKRLARLFDVCTATTRAEWETLEGYRTGVATDWFPNGVDSGYFAPSGRALRPRHHLLRRAHGLLPEPGVHVRLLRKRAAAHTGAPPGSEAAHRRRRSFAGGEEARRTARRHGHGLGARRAPVPPATRRSWSRRSTSPGAPRTRSWRPWPRACRW